MNPLEAREAQWANLYSQRKKIESWDENYTSGLGKYENQNLYGWTSLHAMSEGLVLILDVGDASSHAQKIFIIDI